MQNSCALRLYAHCSYPSLHWLRATIRQAWYEETVVPEGAARIVGVYDTWVYYQTDAENGVSSLIRHPLYLVSDEYTAAADTLENVVVATSSISGMPREAELISDRVIGNAVLDESAGYVYYVNYDQPYTVNVMAEYAYIGVQNIPLYAADSQILELRLTASGLAFRTETGAYLYLPMLNRALAISPEVFSEYRQAEMLSGSEVLLTADNTLIVRVDAAQNTTLTVNDSVQEFCIYDGFVYYLRRTRWLTEINKYDPVTRSSKLLARLTPTKEFMGQIVCAGEYLYIMDTDYTVYRVSPSTGCRVS